MDPARRDLIEHVLRVQATVRTCEGCGQCCTDAFNSVAIVPVEARRIAAHLQRLPEDQRAAWRTRIEDAIERYGLRIGGKTRTYTCPFLQEDLTCALPFEVKPVACLAFNPTTPDSCDMDGRRFESAHASAEAQNRESGLPERRVPIPVAVLAAVDHRIPQRGAGNSGSAPARQLPEKPVALPRLLSKWGICSRKDAEQRVRNGQVAVDGRVVRDVLFEVKPDRARITVDGKPVPAPARHSAEWIAVNKPRGVVTTTSDPEGRKTIMDVVGALAAKGVMPVGRLDASSAGLILLTNDHVTADRLLDPHHHVSKTYRVKVRGHPTEAVLADLTQSTLTEDGLELGPFDSVDVVSEGPKSTWILVTLREGKNRQIRRRLSAVGHEVETLVRTRFGPIELGDLPQGASRPLTSEEVSRLHGMSGPRRPQ